MIRTSPLPWQQELGEKSTFPYCQQPNKWWYWQGPFLPNKGKVLKAALDTHNHAGSIRTCILKNTASIRTLAQLPELVCQGNDSRQTRRPYTLKRILTRSLRSGDFPTSMPASDDCPFGRRKWNKRPYTASEVVASPSNHNHAGTYEPVFTKKRLLIDFGTAAEPCVKVTMPA